MSESFQTVCVKDDRLNCKDHVKYAVEKGGANVTCSVIQANSQTNTSHVYNVIVPSEQTIVDRRVDWSSTIQFHLTFTNLPACNGAPGSGNEPYDLIQYGFASALSPFPLHAASTVVSSTINNNTISQNMDDVLQPIIRFLDRKKIHKYTGVTPVMPDNYFSYATAKNTINNPLGSYSSSEKESDYHARGAFPLISANQTPGYIAGFDTVYTGLAAGTATLYIQVRVTEPFMLSPFIFAHEKQNDQGFYGIQNLNFKMNMNPQARIWRTGGARTDQTVDKAIPNPVITIDSYVNSQLVFFFLTPHPEDLLPAKNCVGFLEMPRYLTNSLPDVPAGASVQIQSQTLQLNQVNLCLKVF